MGIILATHFFFALTWSDPVLDYFVHSPIHIWLFKSPFQRYMTRLYTSPPSPSPTLELLSLSFSLLMMLSNLARKWHNVGHDAAPFKWCLHAWRHPSNSLVTKLLSWQPAKWRKQKLHWSCAKPQNLVPQTDRLLQNINPVSLISQWFPIFPCNFWSNSHQNQGRDVDQTNPQKSLVKLIVWCVIICHTQVKALYLHNQS